LSSRRAHPPRPSLRQFVAGRALHLCPAGLVAVDAAHHLGRHGGLRQIHLPHLAVAAFAFHLGRQVRGMAEEHKVRNAIRQRRHRHGGVLRQRRQPLDGGALLLHRLVADHARSRLGHSGARLGLRRRVAQRALQFQPRVPRVAERDGLLRRAPAGYGSEKATSESEKSLLYLFPPPAAITMYCLPLRLPTKVMGEACALAGSMKVHSSLPLSLSKARKRLSLVAPMKTSPPAVTSDPPILGAPVGGMPLASSASTTPSTLRQRNSPRSRSMAVRNPQGGFWHGYRFGSQKRELGVPMPCGR